MSIVFADFPSGSPGLYGTSWQKMLDGLYTLVGHSVFGADGTVTIQEDPDPNTTGSCIAFPQNFYGAGGSYGAVRKPMPGGATVKVGLAARYWFPSMPQEVEQIPYPMRWMTGGNAMIAGIRVSPTGSLEVVNNVGAVIGQTNGPAITTNGWWHIEAQMTASVGAAGSITVWVEGVKKIDLVGLTTAAASTTTMEIAMKPSGVSANPAMYVKDLVIWDGLGAVNSGQLGPCIVCDLTPNADVSSGWTSTGPNNWSVVDEAPPNDADYIEAATPPPAPSIMQLSNLPANIVAVRGLVSVARLWKTDGGDATVAVGLSPDGAAWDDGIVQTPTTAPLYFADVSDVSPLTGVRWTPVEVNAARLRLNRLT